MTLGFAVLATARSMLDLDGDESRSVSRVLRSTGGAMVRFLLIPITSLFIIMLSTTIMSSVMMAVNSDGTRLSRMVFLVSSLDALNESTNAPQLNSSGTLKEDDEPVTVSPDIGTKQDRFRKEYVYGNEDYTAKNTVKRTFSFARFDYLVGYGVGLFLIIILGICLVNFICRIFEVLLLFIASPLFVSVMPLDHGEKFKAWQDMFVAKIFGGFGSVIAMELYMMLCPVVMAGNISFVTESSSAEANYLIRLIFLMGGAWAVIKAGPTITQLLNYQAGMAEQDTGARVTAGMVGAASFAGSKAMAGVSAAKQKFQESRSEKAASRKVSDERIKKSLTGTGGRFSSSAASSTTSTAALSTTAASSASSGTRVPRTGSAFASGLRGSTGTSGGASSANRRTRSGTVGAGITGRTVAPAPRITGSSTRKTGTAAPRITGSSAGRTGTAAPRITGSSSGSPAARVDTLAKRTGSLGGITVNTTKSGISYPGVDLGKKLTVGRDQAGNFRCQVFGVGVRTSGQGGVDKVSLPFVRLKRDSAGSFHVSKVKLPGMALKRAETVTKDENGKEQRSFGTMYWSDIKPIGVKRRFDQETGKVEKLQVQGSHYGKDRGNSRMSHKESTEQR